MARAMRAERVADAARYRLLVANKGPHQTPRMLIAKALRSLASLLDGEVTAKPKSERQFVPSIRGI
jgi:hypothetical protein